MKTNSAFLGNKKIQVDLYYYDLSPNIGDALNVWLWERVLPICYSKESNIRLCGIGTLINQKLPTDGTIIFGSGVGYEDKLPSLKDSQVFFLRGPLSARKLNLPQLLAITDPAILVYEFNEKFKQKKEYKYGLILHHRSKVEPFKTLCRIKGLNFISPEIPVEKFFEEIQKCEVVVCEAMHGAIIADSFRIPWIPVIYNSQILKFKWQDWCASMNLEYLPSGWTKGMGYCYKLHRIFLKFRIPWFMNLMGYFWIREIKKRKEFISEEKIFNDRISRIKNELVRLYFFLIKNQ